MIDLNDWKKASRLLRVPLRTFLTTFTLMICLGGALAGTVFYFLAQHQLLYGIVGAVLTILEALVLGMAWARTRALTMTIVLGLETYGIGRSLVHLIFGRLLGVPEPQEGLREPVRIVAITEDRLPLAQAESKLAGALATIRETPLAPRSIKDLVRFWLQSILLAAIQKYTVARFRESGKQDGKVDLIRLRAELESRVDGLLIGTLKRRLKIWTLMALVGFPLQVLALLYLALAYLNAHG